MINLRYKVKCLVFSLMKVLLFYVVLQRFWRQEMSQHQSYFYSLWRLSQRGHYLFVWGWWSCEEYHRTGLEKEGHILSYQAPAICKYNCSNWPPQTENHTFELPHSYFILQTYRVKILLRRSQFLLTVISSVQFLIMSDFEPT